MNLVVVVGSFLFFLVLFTGIGIMSAKQKEATSEDYLVASRNINPWLTALSAVSTNNSGYMFIGLIGFAWRDGIQAAWITFGFILGDLITWFWVHKRVRAQSEQVKAASVPALLATDVQGNKSRVISVAAGLLTFFFLGAYAAAQLKAGSATLHALFDWPHWAGAVIGVVVVAIYCMSGGIRASIWTDAAQSVVMIGAMTILVGTCWSKVGGPSELMAALEQIEPRLVQLFPAELKFGLGLYLLGYLCGGMGTIGQPHILIRFMAIDSVGSISKARVIYFIWYTLFSAAALAAGLYSRVLLPDLGKGPDGVMLTGSALETATEGALPELAVAILPAVLIGVMLAGIFSATMSTADSQILSCSAAITQDIFPRWQHSYAASKIATLTVAAVALVIALAANEGVFFLVLLAWAVLTATIGPMLLVRLAGLPLPDWIALTMMASGTGTVIIWGKYPDLANAAYKALPGLAVPLVLYACAYPMIKNRDS